VDIEWTRKATERLKDREYRYFSPTFYHDKGRITEYVNTALTNLPATKDQEPLVASRSTDHRAPVTAGALSFGDLSSRLSKALSARYGWEAYVVELYDDRAIFDYGGRTYQVAYSVEGSTVSLAGEAEEVHRTYAPVDGGTMKALLTALGLAPTATEAEAVSALTAIQAAAASASTLVALAGKPNAAEAQGVFQAWKAASEKVVTLTARVTELEGAETKAKMDTLITAGKAAGKLPPALEAIARSWSVETLTAYLEAAPALPSNAEEKPPAGGPVAALNEAELAVCSQLGLTPEQFVAQRATLRA
jgi:phage I-like protein